MFQIYFFLKFSSCIYVIVERRGACREEKSIKYGDFQGTRWKGCCYFGCGAFTAPRAVVSRVYAANFKWGELIYKDEISGLCCEMWQSLQCVSLTANCLSSQQTLIVHVCPAKPGEITALDFWTRKMLVRVTAGVETGSQSFTSGMSSRCRRGLYRTAAGAGGWRRPEGDRHRASTGPTGDEIYS